MIYSDNKKFFNQHGIVSVMTVLIIAFLTSMVIALSGIVLPRLKVALEIKKSVTAIYAADSAIEWCLYLPKANVQGPVMQNGATYTLTKTGVVSPACAVSGAVVQAVGTYQGVNRSLQASGF